MIISYDKTVSTVQFKEECSNVHLVVERKMVFATARLPGHTISRASLAQAGFEKKHFQQPSKSLGHSGRPLQLNLNIEKVIPSKWSYHQQEGPA